MARDDMWPEPDINKKQRSKDLRTYGNDELHELCMQVAHATGWDDESLAHDADEYPFYTSDYLLGKLLCAYHESHNGDSVYIGLNKDDSFYAVANVGGRDNSGKFFTHKKTDGGSPLIALLNLVLSLLKEGLL